MPLRIVGLRLGVNVHTPSGTVRNGAIDDPAHCEYLTSIGYRLQKCAGIPEPEMTEEELAELERITLERESFQRMVARGFSELLAPLRKKTYRNQFE